MELTQLTVYRLTAAALLPVFMAILFYLLEKNTPLGALSRTVKGLVFGVGFGVAAIFGAEFGLPAQWGSMSVSSAAPLTAGLIFGWPSGLIAGVIGGLERWLVLVGEPTRMAACFSTILAGALGASVRKFMMENRQGSWFYGMVLGITSEVLHMVLVVTTNLGNIRPAFRLIRACGVPLIVASGLSVMMAILVVASLEGYEDASYRRSKKTLAQKFQHWLVICVILAFVTTILFSGSVLSRISYSTAETTLRTNMEDIRQNIHDVSDQNLLRVTREIARNLPEEQTVETLQRLAMVQGVSEINLVNANGIIVCSTLPELIGFDMRSGSQSAAFLPLVLGDLEMVQEYQSIVRDPSVYRKYAGVSLEEGFVQVGYDTHSFYDQLREQVRHAAVNRHVGQEGHILICDGYGLIISGPAQDQGKRISEISSVNILGAPAETCIETEINGVPSLVMRTDTEGYYIIAVMSRQEAYYPREVTVYTLAFMELLVFSALFVYVFVLIKRLVVRNIHRINSSLERITEGDLGVRVDVRSTAEFASLSDGINTTVDALKHYIDAAAARLDKDLEIAKTIQHSALPSVFPPYPNRKDFCIYASMDAAKEVGGDFYDFYLLDDNHLAFVVADVSGKGIPGAMFMMTSKALIKGYAESGMAVDEIFTQVNEDLCENNEAGMFVTAWMGIMDLESGLITYANAGHNPPVIRRGDGSWAYLKGKVNLVLAGMEGIRYVRQEITLQQGDSIYLYTDGITEAHDIHAELFGEDRLLDSLQGEGDRGVEEICKKVKADVDAYVGQAEQFDDMTMLCVRLNERGDKMMTVNPTMESVPQVAAFVEEQLESHEIPVRMTRKLMVALDEIYSNIVRYSEADQAEIIVGKEGDTLKMVFRDNGKPYDPLAAGDPDITANAEDRAIGGLGVFMVRKMMDHVEYMYLDGKNILTLTVKV